MIGDNIKRLRTEKGLSQTALGKMLDVEQAYISMLETGKRKANNRMIFALGNIFKVSILEIDPDFDFVLLGRGYPNEKS